MIAAEFAGDAKGGCRLLSLLVSGELEMFLNATVAVRLSVLTKEVGHALGNGHGAMVACRGSDLHASGEGSSLTAPIRL